MGDRENEIRGVLTRATGTGWEAAYRADVAYLLDRVEAMEADRDILAEISETLDGGAAPWPELPRLVAWVSRRATVGLMEMEGRAKRAEARVEALETALAAREGE